LVPGTFGRLYKNIVDGTIAIFNIKISGIDISIEAHKSLSYDLITGTATTRSSGGAVLAKTKIIAIIRHFILLKI